MIPTMMTTREEGEVRGRRGMLRAQLDKRFGPLSETALQRLESLPPDKLTELALALLDAQSLKELGLED